MPNGDARRHAWSECGPQVIAVETVIGNEHHRGVRSGKLDQPMQHHVMNLISHIHDVLIDLKILVPNPIHFRRMIGHEIMAYLIECPEINGHEVPFGIGFHHIRRGRLNRIGLGQFLRELVEPPILRLVHLMSPRHKCTQHVIAGHFPRTHPQRIEFRSQRFRPVGSRHRWRPGGGRCAWSDTPEMAEHIRNHPAVQPALALRAEPSDDMAPQPALAEHLPQRAALSGGGGNGDHFPAGRVHLRETLHAMMIGHLARGNGRPQHRRKLRLQRRQIARSPALDQSRDRGELSAIQQRVDQLPIGGIPSHEQKAFLNGHVPEEWKKASRASIRAGRGKPKLRSGSGPLAAGDQATRT